MWKFYTANTSYPNTLLSLIILLLFASVQILVAGQKSFTSSPKLGMPYFQRNLASAPTTPDLQTNLNENVPLSNPRVATLFDGKYVIVWERDLGGANPEIWMKIFHPDGSVFQEQAPISTPGSAHSRSPDIAALNDGGFIVVWVQTGYIYARLYNGIDYTANNPFLVNAFPSPSDTPSVVGLASGRIIIVWVTTVNTNIQGRILNPNGAVHTSDTDITNDLSNDDSKPRVAALSGGGFAMAWIRESMTPPFKHTIVVALSENMSPYFLQGLLIPVKLIRKIVRLWSCVITFC